MDLMTLRQIRQAVPQGPLEARVHIQLETVASKATREQKPYCELALADACDRMTLRVWSDHPNYKACDSLQTGDFIEISGEFAQHQQYGLDARRWTTRALARRRLAICSRGRRNSARDKPRIGSSSSRPRTAIRDPRLRALCEAFIAEQGDRFRNTAGARTYHHARRGGLVEHTAQMMRVATAIAPLYPHLNLDLLIAGILFHDSGKLWENHLPENGFTMAFDERGELMGHISHRARNGEFALAKNPDRSERRGRRGTDRFTAIGRCPSASAPSDRVRTTANRSSVRPSVRKRRKRWR